MTPVRVRVIEGLAPEIGNGEAIEGKEDEPQKDHDPDGEGVIDNRESQGIRLRNPEKAETENTEVVPVSDKAGRRGDGDPDDQNDHQNEGRRNRQVEAEGQKEQIDY